MLQKISNIRRNRKAFAFTLSFLSLLLVVSIIGISKPEILSEAPVSLAPVSKEMVPAAVPAVKTIEAVRRVRRGDTIINALKREGFTHMEAFRFFNDVKPVYNLRKIRAGKTYSLFSPASGGGFTKFRYHIEPNRYLEVSKNEKNGVYQGKIVTVPYVTKKEIVKGEIEVSLFQSIVENGENAELADLMASLYEYDIDFNRDLRKKDSFALVVEKRYLNGKFVTYGDILAAEFVNRGKAFRIIRYTDLDGYTAYYHPDGRSVRKMFLRCPLPFMRVTSSFGNRRHPVLGFSARHNGVDFGAPTGTKVRATATGVVTAVGYNRLKGRYIHIRHPNRYISHYYHLSRVERKVKRGVKVEQGEVIGRVGSTGLSTGPHLHYGLRKNGRFTNPLRLKSPTKNPIKKKYMADFKRFVTARFLVLSGSRLMDIPKPVKDVLLSPSAGSRLRGSSGLGL